MQAGREYAFEVRATNGELLLGETNGVEIQLNNNSVYKTRGALRVGAWKPVTDEDALNEAVAVAQSSDGMFGRRTLLIQSCDRCSRLDAGV